LLGDLVEQYQHGRSRSWYWRQVVVAVIVATIQDLREHKLPVVRATSVGIAVVWLLGWAFPTFWVGKAVWNWTVENNLDTIRMVLFRQSALIVTVFIPTFFWTVGGWAVARTHRPRAMAMVFAFLVCFHLIYLGQLTGLYRLPVSAALSAYRPRIIKDIFHIRADGRLLLLTTVFAVVGGLLGARDAKDAPREMLAK
jgi:hypothetical protein